jgi:L-Ala-D/L-Glu epimerase
VELLNWTWRTEVLQTLQPFGIARWSNTDFPRTFVTLDVDGIQGRGEAAPNAYYGETRETVEAILPRLLEVIDHPWDWEGLHNNLEHLFPTGHPSVKCAYEMATLEWCARSIGKPVWQMLGLSPVSLPESSYTVGLADVQTMQNSARMALKRGYGVLKVKLGAGVGDIAIITALREIAPQVKIRVDANASWSRSQAKKMINVLEAHDIELLEQPLHAQDLEGHAELRRLSKVPIIADESLHGRDSLPHLREAFDGVNLKIAKLGGPLQTLHTLRTARSMGMGVMIGCMIESSLGISAAAHLSGLADWVDLDGATLLKYDPFVGLEWRAGFLKRPMGHGWGVDEHLVHG